MAWIQWDKLCDSKDKGGMGFRDLRTFNLAMLAKQGWHLQQGRNSLFYRVFKTKYFPDEDFINAKKGHHPSFAWRRIWAAQSLLKDGLKWQVGNGRDVYIWKDKWTPNPTTFQIISPLTILPIDAKVSALIDEENGVWKTSLIRELFLDREVESILSPTLPTDKLVWTTTKN